MTGKNDGRLEALFLDFNGIQVLVAGHFQKSTQTTFKKEFDFTLSDDEYKRIYLVEERGTAGVLEDYNLSRVDPIAFRNIRWVTLQRLADDEPVQLVPGVENLIKEASSIGAKIGTVTNNYRREVDLLSEKAGLNEILSRYFFDPNNLVLVTREDFLLKKPNSDPYLLALSRLGTFPSRCLAIEDKRKGIESALSAGIPVLGLGEKRPSDIGEKDKLIMVKSLEEVDRYFLNSLPERFREISRE